jgi:hypothetical protein
MQASIECGWAVGEWFADGRGECVVATEASHRHGENAGLITGNGLNVEIELSNCGRG